MDDYFRSLNSSKDRRFDRNRRDHIGPMQNRTGRYNTVDRRSKRTYKQGFSHPNNQSASQDILVEIRKLLKEIIVAQKKTLALLDAHGDFDRRIAVALELIATRTP